MKMEMTAKDEKTKAKERDSNTHKLTLSIKHTHKLRSAACVSS